MNKYYCSQLKNFRKLADRKTQAQLAEELDISTDYLRSIEAGRYNPSFSLHVNICLTLKKPSDCFLFQDRVDMVLNPEQINYLKSLESVELKRLIDILQDIDNKV